MDARWQRIAEALLATTLLLMSMAGVGVLHLFTGQAFGTGLQPAFVPLLLLLLLFALRVHHGRWPWSWTLWIAWVIASCTWTWTADDMGLAGETPWGKSLKQTVVFVFFATSAVATLQVLRASTDASRRKFERAASIGLAIACAIALWQGLAFDAALPGAEALLRMTSSNPSIAAGSEELYLGHSFVGIARLRGPMPEPLLFGSFLLAVIPVTAAAAYAHRGRARWWRAVVATVAGLCLLATFSRGAWVGAVVTAALVGLGMSRGALPRPRGRSAWVGGALVLVGGLVGAWFLTGRAPWELPALLAARVGQTTLDHDMSNLTRWWAWRAAWDLFTQAPLQGIGFGAFGFGYFQVAPVGADAAHFGWPMANSLPLQLLAETGAVGLVLGAWALRPSLAGLLARRPGPAAYLLACVCAGLLVQSLTFSQWNLPHLWLAVAFSAAMRKHREDVA